MPEEAIKIDFEPLDMDVLESSPKEEDAPEPEIQPVLPNKAKRSRVLKRYDRATYRRAFSETQLLDLTMKGFPFKDGDAYHFITGGDVDSLSYLKIILRQQKLDYCLLSTWCMAQEDIFQIRDYLDDGKIKRMDAYVGEIFPGTYRVEYNALKPIIERYGGRVCVFRNHAKIWAGTGKKFAFGIQTSANMNENPRTEQGCITIGKDIFEFYKAYFDGIVSFE